MKDVQVLRVNNVYSGIPIPEIENRVWDVSIKLFVKIPKSFWDGCGGVCPQNMILIYIPRVR